MRNHNIGPAVLQIFSDQTPVTLMRLFLAAQKTCAIEKVLARQRLNLPRLQQFVEAALILAPATLLLLICIQHLLCRSERRQMNVIDLADGLRKKPKIVPLRESGQLRNIVQPHIHQSRNAGPF